MTVGRNDPCPCGSGRKYKRCHLAADTATNASSAREVTSPFHELDNHLVDEMGAYAAKRFAAEFLDEAAILQTYPEIGAQFAVPWLVYVAEFEGRPIIDWYIEERGWSLSRPATEWLAAQQKSWLSIWEVEDVDPGKAIVLHDLLTGERRTVHEVSASKVAKRHYALLGRIVDAGSVSLICGMHGIPLRPAQVAPVIETVRRALRRRTAVAPERLRESSIVWKMLNAWSDAIERFQTLPTLVNTDGDPLLLTQDRWSFAPAKRKEIVAQIETIEGTEAEESESGDVFIVVREGNRQHKDWDNTIIGRIEISDVAILSDTNSIARADALRLRIEEACQGLVHRGKRSHTDPTAALAQAPESPREPARTPTPEEQAIVLEYKERHYAQWLHDSIPALGGKTPREAARTKNGREKLETILKEIELTESHVPESARYNVHKLRRELGLQVGLEK
jgi:hypothetical protein